MNILIVSAMEEEINFLVESFNLKKIDTINQNSLYVIEGKSRNIFILNSGIGKVNSSITTSQMLSKYQIDKLISIGTSGALTNATKIGDFVVGERLAYHDVDVTAFGYEYGQLPKCDKYFETTKDSFWETIISEFSKIENVNTHKGDIITGDKFINDLTTKEFINKNFPQGLCVEMESTAIVHTAKSFGVDAYALRSISDNADQEADISFEQYLSEVCVLYKMFVDIILNNE